MQENKERNKQICNLISQGYSYRGVASMFKISHQRVHQIFRTYRPVKADAGKVRQIKQQAEAMGVTV